MDTPMPCWGPLTAYYPKGTSNDKRLVFRKDLSETGIPIKVPCGRCSGCRLEHSRQWALRCMHEKRMHTNSAFLTLTYSDANLPSGNTLVKRDLQLFMKRLRKIYPVVLDNEGNNLNAVRFFACGEYGEKTNRPHYHVLLLNQDFNDRKLIKSGSEYNLYASATLSQLWTAGYHAIGDVNFHSAAYVARYCMKKQTGPKAKEHYNGRETEFIVMSRRPGIGTSYVSKYAGELYTHDNCIVNGFPSSLPRFYDNKYASLNDTCEMRLELLKIARRRKINRADTGTTRLRIREVVTLAKLAQKGRTL
ncbi:replication initiator protein [robinz microvirus RP_78]|nr:replication initiator protein [robinz microvirus RP_78]